VRDIVAQGKLKVCKISTHDNPADMMTKPILIAKFELCSSLVGITNKLKWLSGAKSVFFVVQEIVEVHATRNLYQGGVCYIVIQIHL
jgi:hypothetical protein